jgi:hypothetical protein
VDKLARVARAFGSAIAPAAKRFARADVAPIRLWTSLYSNIVAIRIRTLRTPKAHLWTTHVGDDFDGARIIPVDNDELARIIVSRRFEHDAEALSSHAAPTLPPAFVDKRG